MDATWDEWFAGPGSVTIRRIGRFPLPSVSVSVAERRKVGFLAGAFVVASSMRLMDSKRLDAEVGSPARPGCEVLLFSCQANLIAIRAQVRQLLRPRSQSAASGKRLQRMDELVQQAAAADGLQLDEPLVSTLLLNPAGAISTSYAQEYQLRVGLHVDNHESLTVLDRPFATPVCCVNVGTGPREFVFVPQTVEKILTKVNAAPTIEAVSSLPELLFTLYPETPVVRVEIPPGCGYIATAQNLIHDGSAALSDKPDRALISLRRSRITV